ncbi:hypothetical protein ACBR40_34460 [Nonomuraea sp. AD125B]|uniref:hypothetical protein n=1 Tax=Nonomuraea sp. AD125B TaxID=3242897 RepID=UPI0035279886
MSGEEAHFKGQDGAQRAKRWLDATTRVNVRWVNPEPHAVRKLTFYWTDGEDYSFDLGGIFLGDELDGQEFFAESKNYKNASDQGGHYVKYLAGCYRAYDTRPERCDNFMWITWSPFNTTTWDKLMAPDTVKAAVLKFSGRVLGEPDEEAARGLISEDICKAVSERLWMIVLSERQERHLTLSQKHLAVIRYHDTNGGLL